MEQRNHDSMSLIGELDDFACSVRCVLSLQWNECQREIDAQVYALS